MTAAGPCIQVEPGGYQATSAQQKAVSRDRGSLVSVSDLAQPALRSAGRVVILQAEPSADAADEAREIRRSEADALRGLAGQALAAGVPTVMVLPRLPSDLAGQAIGHIQRALEQMRPDRPDDPRPWLAAADRIREDVVSKLLLGREGLVTDVRSQAAGELAWDVTLFCQQRAQAD
jgi:hypothetical protein